MTPRLLAIAALLFAAPAGAQSVDWQVCNQTSFILRIATGTVQDGALTVEGWREALPGQCRTTKAAAGTDRYVLAESLPLHAGGIREWRGEEELCAGEEDFTAVADPDRSCALQNLDTRSYLRVAPDEERTLLVEPENYGDKAETAGLQRLLRDAGQRVRRIDGLAGRATTRTVRAFLKARELPANTSGDALIDALREAAAERREALGITVCNESSQRVWAATALKDSGRWTSRGWWPIEVETCVQTTNGSVEGKEPHVFALQEQALPEPDPDDPDAEVEAPPDKRLRAVATTPSRFCISEGRFSAMGREDCRDRGYASANFRALTEDDEEGVRITLTDADFVEPSGSALRR